MWHGKMRWRSARWIGVLGVLALAVWAGLPAQPAASLTIELKDVAADRVERQRRAVEGNLPLPGTPDLSRFSERLTEQGLKVGMPAFIRIFKAESELEVWLQKDGQYVLFATYPVCHWSGTLGPKVQAGDKQAPEGFYTVTRNQLHLAGRWPRSLNLGFPNAFDKSLGRTGNYILVHGGCSSIGCYAMTNTVIEEIYTLVEGALREGEEHVPVHVYPFRMTAANVASHQASEWRGFWDNLREGYDSFARTHRPPHVSVCDGHYKFRDAAPEEGADIGPLGWCGATAAAVEDLDRWLKAAMLPPSQWSSLSQQHRMTARQYLVDLKGRNPAIARAPAKSLVAQILIQEPQGGPDLRRSSLSPKRQSLSEASQIRLGCNQLRASCRKRIALETEIAKKRQASMRVASRRHARTANR